MIPIGQRGLVGLDFTDRLIAHQRQGVNVVPAIAQHATAFAVDAHVIAEWEAEIVIEAVRGGQERRLIAEVPLADEHGGVVGLLQVRGNGDLVRMQADRLTRHEHDKLLAHAKPHPLRVTTGHQRRPRR